MSFQSLVSSLLLLSFAPFSLGQNPSRQNAPSQNPASQVAPLAATSPKPMIGYSAESSRIEREWEQKFRALPSTARLRENMRRMTAHPHHVGSPYDKDNAEWMLAQFKQWGFDANIETFYVLFPTPRERALELIAPTRYVATLQEPPVPVDPTSSQTSEQLPTYNAYSPDGDVTAPLVYVNFGIREDYEQLDKLGISVKGAIVIARYGGAWRGIKPKVAAEHGALGCIIYSDPRDDGYAEGDTFPKGSNRPPAGVQRGSVMDTEYPGDPLTPGVGATQDAKRLTLKEAKTIAAIPTLPISYEDALPLLAALAGPVAPQPWRGGLPIPYHLGPGPARVHLKVTSNWDIKPIYDVVAKIPGAIYPGEWVIRGNHHDAWVNGADDPISGMSAELEEARSLGELLRQGWRPQRTILYIAWDGEEPGLLGSTEWVETHAEELRQHAVMYLNSDNTGRGYMRVSGAHTLERFINDVERDVQDPEKKMSVWARARARAIAEASPTEDRNDLRQRAELRITPLGDGSDYAPFLDHAGVPALDLRFGGEDTGGVYHSIYDDFYWYTHFSDTDFVYGRAFAQVGGTAMMRMADADLIPLSFGASAETIAGYVKELQIMLKKQQDEAQERNRELDEGVFTATSDPKKTFVPPPRAELPPFINFAPLENGSAAYTRSAAHFERALAQAQAADGAAYANRAVRQLNQQLIAAERGFLYAPGLPERPWFKHQIYAPGAYTGYGVKTIPAVREALDQKKWKQAEAGAAVVGKVLANQAQLVEAAAVQLEALSENPARNGGAQ